MNRPEWLVTKETGSSTDFHARPLPNQVARQVWLFRVIRPALVLGSAQPASHVDAAEAARAGVEVVRRHSGGGGVLLVPGEVVWADVLVPRGDPVWDDDVGRATWWLGAVWAEALAALGFGGAEVHRGPLVRSEWSGRVCFAGLGPGEVTLAGRKVVGISQRRARGQCRFQTAALLHWSPVQAAALLGGSGLVGDVSGDRAPGAEGLDGVAVGLADLATPDGPAPSSAGTLTVAAVEAAFLAALADR